MKDVVIVSIARTPIGAFLGALSEVKAVDLGATVLKAALERANLTPDQVDQVIMGNVLSGGNGQAPARQAALKAGLANSTPCMTINKVCGSGLKSVSLAANEIMLGNADIVLAGGMESMSGAPFALPKARTGYRMGMPKGDLIDLMVHDGLWDPYGNSHMGDFADLCAREKGFSREELDSFAISSFEKANAACDNGLFKEEITPVEIKTRKGTVVIDTDEGPAKVRYDKIPVLKPVFNKDGVTTPANASTINDGAAAVLLMSAEKAQELGIKPLAKITGYAEIAQEPQWFSTAPPFAISAALQKAGLNIADIDLFEINEAFAAVTLFATRELNIPADKVNVHGGAIALGHPIGATGCRILVTLLSAMQQRKVKRGIVSLCIGGGEGNAMIVEAIEN